MEGKLTNSRPIPLEAPCTMETPPSKFKAEEDIEDMEARRHRDIDLMLSGVVTNTRWFKRKSLFILHFV